MQTTFTDLEFTYTYTVTKSNDSTYTFNLYYEIPYRNLYFYKDQNRFYNRYELRCQIFHKQILISGEIFTKSIYLDNYEQTMQTRLKHRDQVQLTFTLPSANISSLNVFVDFQDRHSSNQVNYQFKINLPDLYTQILFYTNRNINPTHTYQQATLKNDTLNLKMTIYHPQLNACSLFITKYNEIFDATPRAFRRRIKTKSHIVFRDHLAVKEKINLADEDTNYDRQTTITYQLPLIKLTDFGAGSYHLKITGYDTNEKILFSALDSFTIAPSRFDNDKVYLEMVNQLMYIATESEMKRLKQIPVAQRESAWHTFWKTYDPTPTTEINEREVEYFQRINYCIDNFSKGDYGYRSQRARVYMKYGPADFIETRPFEQNSRPLEIWYYYTLNKKFIFIDYNGFGEYVLYQESQI